MKKILFLIDGASGTGKTDLIEYVESKQINAGILRKMTSRPIREEEKRNKAFLDLEFYSQDEFDSMMLDYTYEYRGYSYGFSKQQLNHFLKLYKYVFIIIRSIALMRKLVEVTKSAKVIKVYIHSDPSKVEQRLTNQGFTNDQINFRLSRIEEIYREYVLNSSFYDEVIVNNSDKGTYHRLIDNLLNKYSQSG